MKKKYVSPSIVQQGERNTAVPLLAPLAIFSASTAAAAVVGTAAGALAAKKALKASPDELKNLSLAPICN